MADSIWDHAWGGTTTGVINKGTPNELRFTLPGIARNEAELDALLKPLLELQDSIHSTIHIKHRGCRGKAGGDASTEATVEIKKDNKYRRKGDGAIITAIAPEEAGPVGVNAWICRDDTGAVSVVSVEDLLPIESK